MEKMIRLALLVNLLMFSSLSFAGPGHGHSHSDGHEHHHGPISSDQAVKKATKHVRKLVKKGKIEASWSEVVYKSVEEKSFGHGPEWVVTFENKSVTDPAKQTLYIFYTIKGKYLASNFTGQ